MLAKIKKTGEIVDVKVVKFEYTKDNYIDDNGEVYYADELDFNFDTPQKQSVTIEGFVARDRNGNVYFYDTKPVRDKCLGYEIWASDGENIIQSYQLPISSFPDLKWEDEPIKVKLTIERI